MLETTTPSNNTTTTSREEEEEKATPSGDPMSLEHDRATD